MTSDTHRQTVAEVRHTCGECGRPVAKKAVLCFSCWAKESGQESLGDRMARLERERDEAREQRDDLLQTLESCRALLVKVGKAYDSVAGFVENVVDPDIARIRGADRE